MDVCLYSSQHTTLSASSTCIADYIRKYFQTGALPAKGTVCEPDAVPFQVLPGANPMRGLEQSKLTEAVWELAKNRRSPLVF